MRTPASGEWPFLISRDGRLRHRAGPGCEKCKCRVAMIVRLVAQIAHRLLDLDRTDLVWLPRACHGPDNPHAPHSKREYVETTVHSLVRGSPDCAASVDFWPGRKALNWPSVASNGAEPQAEPPDVPHAEPSKVAFLDAELSSVPACGSPLRRFRPL